MILLEENIPFSYEKIGKFELKDKWTHPKRVIKSYELIVVLEGTLYISEEDTPYVVKENEAIVLEPGKLHFGTKSVTESVSFYWLHYQTNLMPPIKTLSNCEMYGIKYLLKKLLHDSNSDGVKQDELDAQTYVIFKELERLCERSKSGDHVLIGLIKEYVRNNANKSIGVADVAKEVGYNKDYVGKLFLKNTGTALKDYIAKKKVAFAENLLMTTDMSVKEISAELGYKEENTFIKFFKYHEKISPKNFKKQFFNTHLNNR
jgi:YesN/AraC family two-component response regulator